MNYTAFNHLILLIGTNPLPNFVVADYFLRHNPNIETVWLLHSEAKWYQLGQTIGKPIEAGVALISGTR